MQYAVYKGEAGAADLVKRLYQIKGPKAKSLTAKAEKALLQANPRLAKLKKKDAGAIILVPDIPGVKTSGDVQRADTAHSEIFSEIRSALEALGPVMDAAANFQMEQAKEVQKKMRSAKIKKVFESTPELKAMMPGITQRAKARGEETKARKALFKKAILRLKKDLDAFEKMI
jgi:ElaB/YqjD/DUF883 family membrane-anchored ribosome-binding protein